MPTDTEFRAALKRAIDTKTKPLGALGRIEDLAAQIALVQGTLTPDASACDLVIFAGDHGIADAGVSAFPKAVTREMVRNFLAEGAAANVFANTLGASVSVVDAGIAEPLEAPGLKLHRLGAGTANSAEGPAMSAETAARCLGTGKEIGANLPAPVAAFGEMGIGNTATASLMLHKITGLAIGPLAGPGTGLDADGVARKRGILEQAAARTGALSPMDVLVEYGGFEVGMMAGAMMGAAGAAKLVLVDGYIATTAAILAAELMPEARANMVFAHRSAEPAHDAALAHLGAEPLLDLGLRLGEGTGALLAWPLLKSAARMLTEMASFEDAGVSGPS